MVYWEVYPGWYIPPCTYPGGISRPVPTGWYPSCIATRVISLLHSYPGGISRCTYPGGIPRCTYPGGAYPAQYGWCIPSTVRVVHTQGCTKVGIPGVYKGGYPRR